MCTTESDGWNVILYKKLLSRFHLGHTNLIICFSDWVEKKKGPGRQAKKKKEKKVNIIKTK